MPLPCSKDAEPRPLSPGSFTAECCLLLKLRPIFFRDTGKMSQNQWRWPAGGSGHISPCLETLGRSSSDAGTRSHVGTDFSLSVTADEELKWVRSHEIV